MNGWMDGWIDDTEEETFRITTTTTTMPATIEWRLPEFAFGNGYLVQLYCLKKVYGQVIQIDNIAAQQIIYMCNKYNESNTTWLYSIVEEYTILECYNSYI